MKHLIAHTLRFSIPLIAVTRQPESSLVAAADIALIIPNVPEACPMVFAPTSSLTIGRLRQANALAVALMERRRLFRRRLPRVRHPGGQLGKALIRVGDIMHGRDALPLVRRETPMAEVIVVMTAKGFGCSGVVDDDGRLIGVITDGDLRRHMGPELLARSAETVMTCMPKNNSLGRARRRGGGVHEQQRAAISLRVHNG